MQMVMSSDKTKIQIFADWPTLYAKRVTKKLVAYLKELPCVCIVTQAAAGRSLDAPHLYHRRYFKSPANLAFLSIFLAQCPRLNWACGDKWMHNQLILRSFSKKIQSDPHSTQECKLNMMLLARSQLHQLTLVRTATGTAGSPSITSRNTTNATSAKYSLLSVWKEILFVICARLAFVNKIVQMNVFGLIVNNSCLIQPWLMTWSWCRDQF